MSVWPQGHTCKHGHPIRVRNERGCPLWVAVEWNIIHNTHYNILYLTLGWVHSVNMALKQVLAAYKGCVYAFVCLTDGSLYVANVNQTNPVLTLCLHVYPLVRHHASNPYPVWKSKGMNLLYTLIYIYCVTSNNACWGNVEGGWGEWCRCGECNTSAPTRVSLNDTLNW